MITLYYQIQEAKGFNITDEEAQKKLCDKLATYPFEVFRSIQIWLPTEAGMELEEILHFLQRLLEPYMPQIRTVRFVYEAVAERRCEDIYREKQGHVCIEKQGHVWNCGELDAREIEAAYGSRLMEEFKEYLELEYGILAEEILELPQQKVGMARKDSAQNTTLCIDFVHRPYIPVEEEKTSKMDNTQKRKHKKGWFKRWKRHKP